VKCEKCGGEYVLVQKKMMRREAWVNVYKNLNDVWIGTSYSSEKETKEKISLKEHYVKTILLHTWEEEEK